jgi:threonine/homoserine efflux transporter RhtA
MYFSLQYLSLSDAVVLKFLAPILTGFSGVIFLKESLSLKEVVAGSKHFMKCLTLISIYVIQYAVLVELS